MKDWIKLESMFTGFIQGKVYLTFRKPEHFFRKWSGFGISAQVLTQLIQRNIHTINFAYEGKTEFAIFEASVGDFVKEGKVESDYSFGFPDMQYFLPIAKMTKIILTQKEFEKLVQ